MKKEKTEDVSLLPLIENKEKECRDRIAAAEKKAAVAIEKAKEEAKLSIEKRRSSVTEREAKRLAEAVQALEQDLKVKRAEETQKLKALEEELKVRLPLASKEILKMILP